MSDVFDLPEEHPVRVAHKQSIRNRQQLQESVTCGCFHCAEIFALADITEWTDLSNVEADHTALCPRCGIDTVIGDRSGFPITKQFLAEMKKHWFD